MSGALLDGLLASWPPAAVHDVGPFRLREGRGGGSRVSAATAAGPVSAADLPALEAAAARLGQDPIVMVRDGEEALDRLLAAQGWRIADESLLLAAPAAGLPTAPGMAAFVHWPPLAVTAELWAETGIGPARLAVMQRAPEPRAIILARHADRAAGAGFVAAAGGTAFLHAVAVLPGHRRQGCARNILWAAAGWARDQGVATLALAVTRANAAARALYASQGLQVVGKYHYRRK